MADETEGCGVNRAKPLGYYWKQHINGGIQGVERARQHLDKLGDLNNDASATRHLLQIALALNEIQQSLHALSVIAENE